MATPEAVKKALATTAPTKSLRVLVEESAKELGRALPEHLSAERLVRIALTCIRVNPALSECTPESFLGSLFTAAQIGIEPVAGRGYLLPFNNKRKIGSEWKTLKECQFILGYKGLAELFYRHAKAVELAWGVVRDGDEFDYAYGTEAFLKHIPKIDGGGAVIGYYVIAKLSNGGKPFMFMSEKACMEHGQKHSKTWLTKEWKNGSMVACTPHWAESSPWNTNPESMCLKTTLIQLAKILPLSTELQRAIQADESSHHYKKGIGSVLDTPDHANWSDGAHDAQPAEQPIDAEIELGKDKDGKPVKSAQPATGQLPL